ncbi:hypothetical protein [Maricaulis sp.]|uniref:hypothetical protein n=1 Tax=Maricaulis sp. TaxID=1486257 RepID=UPI001B07D29F|nr:hypothetical protein [Maricaulis sp.]MBO6796178.1 hypothetical protein [Maricaulis sp.]
MLSVSITSALLAIGGAGTIYLDFLDARNFEQIREACEPGSLISFERWANLRARNMTVNCHVAADTTQ